MCGCKWVAIRGVCAMGATSCPNPSLLVDYALGRISEADLATIEAHVEACSACQSHLENVDGLSDTVVECLRHWSLMKPSLTIPCWANFFPESKALGRNLPQTLTIRSAKQPLPSRLANTGFWKSWARAAWGRSTRRSMRS